MKYGMIIIFVLLLAGPALAGAADSTAAPPHPLLFDPSRDAAQDIRTAVVEASSTGKRILLDVGGNWCKWCRRLDSLFEADKATGLYLHEKFVVVKVNFSKENKNEALLSTYPAFNGYPHFFVLESDGSLLHSQDTGQFESNHGYDAGKIMAFLTKWTK